MRAQNIRFGRCGMAGRLPGLVPVTDRCGGRTGFRAGSGTAGAHTGLACDLFPGFWAGEGVEFGDYGEGVRCANPLEYLMGLP
jgi:hypothetical protein